MGGEVLSDLVDGGVVGFGMQDVWVRKEKGSKVRGIEGGLP